MSLAFIFVENIIGAITFDAGKKGAIKLSWTPRSQLLTTQYPCPTRFVRGLATAVPLWLLVVRSVKLSLRSSTTFLACVSICATRQVNYVPMSTYFWTGKTFVI